MRLFPQILILILLTASSSLAQPNPNDEPKWLIVKPGGDAFSVETPSAMTVNRMKIDSKRTTLLYSGELESRYFFVAVDFPGPEGFFSVVERLIEEYTSTESGPIVEGATSEYQFKGLDDFYHHIIQTRTAAKIYTFHALSSKENDPMVARFVHSAKVAGKDLLPPPELVERLREETEAPRIDTESPKLGPDAAAALNPSGSGLGSRSGSGSGPGNPQSITRPGVSLNTTDAKKNENRPLRVKSKPKPGYTRFARAYFLSGVVVVRAIFSGSGTVGRIDVVRGLPFGLTEEAIKAAKAVKFDPAIRNGNEVSITRSIEYSFILY